MNLGPTAADVALRTAIRTWLQEHLPWEYGRGLPPRFDDLADEVAFGRRWQAQLAADRWVGVTWPETYGGRGAGPTEHFIVQEELARARAPELVGRIGVNLAGPTLMAHGTEEQRRRWLPGILSADELWCQLFSEPGAGSDLASVSTRATPVEGGWVLDGQKVWTSYAQFADWAVCLARIGSGRPQAPRSVVLGGGHARPRGRGASAGPAHRGGRVQRGVPRRGLRSGRPTRGCPETKGGGSPIPRSPTSGAPTPGSSSSTCNCSRNY